MSGSVGIFWMVDEVLVAAGCELENAVQYGDCLTYEGGHAEHWERWQEAGRRWPIDNGLPLRILASEYDEHPRGRIVREPDRFVLMLIGDCKPLRRLQLSGNGLAFEFALLRSEATAIIGDVKPT